MFTAVFVSHTIFELMYGRRQHITPCRSESTRMELFRQTNIDFLKYKWIAIGASWLLIAVGLFAIFVQKG